MGRGKRYDGESKLNVKKVIGIIVAIIVVIMFVISLQKILNSQGLTSNSNEKVEYFSVYTNNKWGVINSNGEKVIDWTYDEMILVPDSTKPVFICTYDVNEQQNEYKIKVINEKNEVIFTEYETVEAIDNYDTSNNIWYEENVLKAKKDGKYGLINYDGKEILACEYDNIYSLKGIKNSLILEKNNLVGLANNLGEIIIEPQYSQIKALGQDYEAGYIIVDANNKQGIVNINKQVVFEPEFDDVKTISGNNMYVVTQDNTLKLINRDKESLLEGEFDGIAEINGDNIVIIQDNNYGVMSINGDRVISTEYEDLSYAFGEYYIAKKDGKYGLINTLEETQINFEYTNITYVSEANFLEAEAPDFTTVIYNRDLEPKINGIIVELNLEKEYLRVRVNDQYVYYNFQLEEKKNTEILKDNTLFLDKKDGRYGYVDKNNNVVVDYIYEDATEQNRFGYSAVKSGGNWGCIDKTGRVVVEPRLNLDSYFVVDFIGTWHLGEELNMNYYTDME